MPKLVYLDSSDFSNLSCPEDQIDSSANEILCLLREHKKNGTAIFFMSAIHFSEAVHSGLEHKASALRRAELMEELCEDNILRFPTELPKLELRKALSGLSTSRLSLDELLSERGQWFGFNFALNDLVEAHRNIDSEIQNTLAPLPRRERRKLLSDLDLGKKRSHAKWPEIIRSAAATNEFPANVLDPNITIDWFLNEISNQQYRERILEVMHSPSAMFKYILDETKNTKTLYEIIRKQGTATLSDLDHSAEEMRAALTAIAFSEIEIDLTKLINDLCREPSFLRQTISTYCDTNCDHIDDHELETITNSCPSLSSQIQVSKSYLLIRAHSCISRLRAGQTSPKKGSPSDFGDIMHSFYAPYFDIYRCDARFGAILKRHKPIRSRIADRISDLPKMLSADFDRESSVA